MDYQVDLDAFRGPLDLLLFLVKRHEVDICDIPIARITEQFLEYLRLIKLVDVERAGDFLVMAATLMEIKSRMLLPRNEIVNEEETDPRLELVRQLIEYKKFKDAAAMLESQAERQLCRLSRTSVDPAATSDPAQQPLHAVELWDLITAFGRIMRETLALQPQQIIMDETPIHVYQEQILNRLKDQPRLLFSDLFETPRTRGRLVGLFMAILELLKGRQAIVEQMEPFGDIWITAVSASEKQVLSQEADTH